MVMSIVCVHSHGSEYCVCSCYLDATGWYTYFETSSIPRGVQAGLESPLLPGNNSNYCQMEFFYHMYGYHVGSLSVRVTDGDTFKVSDGIEVLILCVDIGV